MATSALVVTQKHSRVPTAQKTYCAPTFKFATLTAQIVRLRVKARL
jgi:hypothetical protein